MSHLLSVLEKEIITYSSGLNPDQQYWKGATWRQTIAKRHEIGNRKTPELSSGQIQDILKWGRITRFNGEAEYRAAIQDMDHGRIPGSRVYQSISSFSKLFSFHAPDRYFILDARVAAALNHLIVKNRIEAPLYPFPPSRSRNKAISSLLKTTRSLGLYEYENMGLAYVAYNDLIKIVHKRISMAVPQPIRGKPEVVEMILFVKALDYAQ